METRKAGVGRRILLATTLLALAGIARGAIQLQLPEDFPAKVETYRDAIMAANEGNRARAIETAHTSVAVLREALLRSDGAQSPLESLSDAEFAELAERLPGVLIERVEVLRVRPDVGYFRELAARYGDDADQDFFAVLEATYPESIWPVYLEPQTDVTGCTRFGTMSLVDTYRAWAEFSRRYPGRYTAPAVSEARAVVARLRSDCACGERAGVEAEIEAFLESFPDSPEGEDLETRLEDLRSGALEVQENCLSG